MKHYDYASFLKYFSVMFFGGLAVIVLLAHIIAPYTPVGESAPLFFNDYRPAAPLFTRRGKIVEITRLKPKAIILGTSRAEIGLDPDHSIFTAKPVFNLAMPKMRISDFRRLLEHAHAHGPLKEAVLGLDFLMFNALMDHYDPFFAGLDTPDKTGPNTAMLSRQVDFAIRKHASFRALADMGKTLKASLENSMPHEYERSPHRADGQRWSVRSVKTKTAQRAIFWAYEVYYLFGDMWRPKNTRAFVFNHTENGKTYDTLNELRKLFAFAYANNIKIYPVILPCHARLWETMRIAGLWPLFELWKAQITLINAEEAIKAGVAPAVIWDFSGYNDITTEPVPRLSDTDTQMEYYLDSSHFKTGVGNMVLDCVSGKTCLENFGHRLKHDTVMDVLTKINADRAKWLDANITESMEILVMSEDKRNAELVYDPFLDVNQSE